MPYCKVARQPRPLPVLSQGLDPIRAFPLDFSLPYLTSIPGEGVQRALPDSLPECDEEEREETRKQKKGEFMTAKYSLEEGMAVLKEQIPEVMNPFTAIMEQVTSDNLLTAKTKRLMMVAVAVSQRCEQCIRAHVKAALELGATRPEILEATSVAILMAGGPAMAHVSTVVLELLDEAGA